MIIHGEFFLYTVCINFHIVYGSFRKKKERICYNKVVFFTHWQVAKKVGCPTDQTMAACLKMTDPVEITLAGTLNLKGSATSKHFPFTKYNSFFNIG